MATIPHSSPLRSAARPGWRLLRHYLEMVAAMFAGMLAFGTVRDLMGLTVTSADRPGLSFLLMATDMTLGMGLWMRARGHDWSSTRHMCAAMYLPAALLPLLWAGALVPMTFMVLAHVLMMIAMAVVLVRHRHHPLPAPDSGEDPC